MAFFRREQQQRSFVAPLPTRGKEQYGAFAGDNEFHPHNFNPQADSVEMLEGCLDVLRIVFFCFRLLFDKK